MKQTREEKNYFKTNKTYIANVVENRNTPMASFYKIRLSLMRARISIWS